MPFGFKVADIATDVVILVSQNTHLIVKYTCVFYILRRFQGSNPGGYCGPERWPRFRRVSTLLHQAAIDLSSLGAKVRIFQTRWIHYGPVFSILYYIHT